MIISTFLGAACCSIALSIFSVNDIGATIDGKKVSFVSMRPVIDGDMIWYPLKNFSVACGAEVSYDAKSGGIKIKNNESIILVTPGSDIAYANNNEVSIEPIRIIDEFSYISHDDFAKLFNLTYQKSDNVIHYNQKQTY